MNLKKPSVLADGESKGNSQKNCYLNSRNKKWIFGDSNIKPQYQYIQAPRIHFSKTVKTSKHCCVVLWLKKFPLECENLASFHYIKKKKSCCKNCWAPHFSMEINQFKQAKSSEMWFTHLQLRLAQYVQHQHTIFLWTNIVPRVFSSDIKGQAY